MIGVVIAADQAQLRADLRVLLDAEGDITVLGEAADGHEALTLVRVLRPAVALLAARMPGLDGMVAARIIGAEPALADTRVIVLTNPEHDEPVDGAMGNGASGFLGTDAEPTEVLRAVRAVAGEAQRPSSRPGRPGPRGLG